MKILHTIDAMRSACRDLQRGGRTLGFVPTMGALHEGHFSLVCRALADCDAVAVSIFVNPTQFGPGEDLEKYPRTIQEDCDQLEALDVDLVFAPGTDVMYPSGMNTFVEVPQISERLDGVSRPGHFRGVTTIVTKLLNITGADNVYFGQKDAAQVAVLRSMVRDLNFAAKLIVCPTVREQDGLAMSSRNRYLSAEDRESARILQQALRSANDALSAGKFDAQSLRSAMLATLASDPRIVVDYAEVVDPVTLSRITEASQGALLAVAARVGSTRLIDNLLVEAAAHEVLA